MNAKEFLTQVWPAVGPYCIARPFTDQEMTALPADQRGKTHRPFKQRSCNTIEEAVLLAEELDRNGHDVYYAVGSLIHATVRNPKGRLIVSRKADNINTLQSFFLDLDVGAEAHKYKSQAEAIGALHQFCLDLKFPKPTLTSSGYGVHAYWTMEDALPRDEWRRHAEELKKLTVAKGLLNDIGLVANPACVLRVVGTHNHKRATPAPVTTLMTGKRIPNAPFLQLIGGTAVTPQPPPTLVTAETNVVKQYPQQEYALAPLLQKCQACAYTADPNNQRQGKAVIPEPAWIALIQTVRLVRKGKEAVHLVSKDDPRYDQPYIDNRLAEWTNKGFDGPADCEQFQEAYAQVKPDICNGCPSKGKIKTPLVLAKYVPVVTAVQEAEAQLPPLPDPYIRVVLKGGGVGIGLEVANAKTEAKDIIMFCPYNMYPTKLTYSERGNTEEDITWRLHRPFEGWVDVLLPKTSPATLGIALQKCGVYVDSMHIPVMHNFMSAYVRKLQTSQPSETAFTKLGWRKDGSFVLGSDLYKKDGTVEPHAMDVRLTNATHRGIHTAGDYDTWKRGVSQYAGAGQEPWRAYFMSGFSSILYCFTGYTATAINASGKPGLGKSTVLEAAASIWGEPNALKITGSSDNSTKAGAEALIDAMNNLPVFMDEITMREGKDVAALIFNYSGGKGKVRSTAHGGVRGDLATWSNFLMLNANHDEYQRLASLYSDSSQHLVRLIQIPFTTVGTLSKDRADAMRRLFHENYGWAGQQFVEYVVRNQTMVKHAVRQAILDTDAILKAEPGERFWTGWIGTNKVAYDICIQEAITPWLTRKDFDWMHDQFHLMRRTVRVYESSGLERISEFINKSARQNTLTIDQGKMSSHVDGVINEPTQELTVRREEDTKRIYISRKAFADYCTERVINHEKVMTELHKAGVLITATMKKNLGAGTKHSAGQIRCMELNIVKLETTNIP